MKRGPWVKEGLDTSLFRAGRLTGGAGMPADCFASHPTVVVSVATSHMIAKLWPVVYIL